LIFGTALLIGLLCSTLAVGQYDFFWSLQPLNSGATNSDLSVNLFQGESVTLYLYYSTMTVEANACIYANIAPETPGIVEITGGETFDFNIVLMVAPNVVVSNRWQQFGPGHFVGDGQSMNLVAFVVTSGAYGVVNSNTGPVFLDLGYDFGAQAFFYGQVELTAVGDSGSTNVQIAPHSGIGFNVLHNGLVYSVGPGGLTAGGLTVNIVSDVLLGDINLDGVVTLHDVQQFIGVLVSGMYQAEADCNQDGNVNLNDVPPFVDILAGG
jgi:hypothetical protein